MKPAEFLARLTATQPVMVLQPRRPGELTARPMVLTDQMRLRGGRKSRRRVARTWVPMVSAPVVVPA